MIKLVSSHHAIVHNPAEITFTSVLLKLKDEIQVSFCFVYIFCSIFEQGATRKENNTAFNKTI